MRRFVPLSLQCAAIYRNVGGCLWWTLPWVGWKCNFFLKRWGRSRRFDFSVSFSLAGFGEFRGGGFLAQFEAAGCANMSGTVGGLAQLDGRFADTHRLGRVAAS